MIAAVLDLALVALVVEAGLLAALPAAPSLRRLGPNLLAGGGLLLGFRLAVAGAGLTWVLACLAGALAGHVLDLSMRWRRDG